MIAIMLAVVVLGAVGAFFALEGQRRRRRRKNGSQRRLERQRSRSRSIDSGSAGSAIAMTPDRREPDVDARSGRDRRARRGQAARGRVRSRHRSSASGTRVKMCAEKLARARRDQGGRARRSARTPRPGTNDKGTTSSSRARRGQPRRRRKKLLGEIPDASVYHKDAEDELRHGREQDGRRLQGDARRSSPAHEQVQRHRHADHAGRAQKRQGRRCRQAVQVRAGGRRRPTDCSTALRNDDQGVHASSSATRNADSPKCRRRAPTGRRRATPTRPSRPARRPTARGEHGARARPVRAGATLQAGRRTRSR